MTELGSERLAADERIIAAQKTISEVIAQYGRELRIRPALTERAGTYRQSLEKFGAQRGSPLFYDYLGSGLGNGPYVELADGSVKLDFIIGIGVHVLGHNHPLLVAAHLQAALRNTTMQGNLQQNTESAEFTRLLLELAQRNGSALEHCIISTSGAMANENALKICFQKNAPATRVLAFAKCFAGRTLALSQVTDKAAFREGLPPTIATDYVPFFNPADPNCTQSALNHLRRHIQRHPGSHAAMIFELVQGEGGFNAGETQFFRALMEEARRHNIAVVVDEIQTFGRTTHPFAFSHFGLDDLVDVVTVGKCTQVCATLYRESYRPRPGLISQTFTGATSSIMAGVAILSQMAGGDYYGSTGRIAQLAESFAKEIQRIKNRFPDRIDGPYGMGAMLAFRVFDGSTERTRNFVQRLFERGVIGFTAGSSPQARVRFLLPFGVLEQAHIAEAGAIIEALVAEG